MAVHTRLPNAHSNSAAERGIRNPARTHRHRTAARKPPPHRPRQRIHRRWLGYHSRAESGTQHTATRATPKPQNHKSMHRPRRPRLLRSRGAAPARYCKRKKKVLLLRCSLLLFVPAHSLDASRAAVSIAAIWKTICHAFVCAGAPMRSRSWTHDGVLACNDRSVGALSPASDRRARRRRPLTLRLLPTCVRPRGIVSYIVFGYSCRCRLVPLFAFAFASTNLVLCTDGMYQCMLFFLSKDWHTMTGRMCSPVQELELHGTVRIMHVLQFRLEKKRTLRCKRRRAPYFYPRQNFTPCHIEYLDTCIEY